MSGRIRIYGLKNCDSCRAARKWLDANGVGYDFFDIREQPLDKKTLKRWADADGWEPLLNRRSATWRKIPEIDRSNLDKAAAVELVLAYPTVMKRPVLDASAGILFGFDADQYSAIVL